MSTETVQRGGVARLGRIALIVAVVALIIEIVAIAVGSARQWQLATVLADIVIGLTILVFIAGVIAAVLDRGRRAGIATAILAVLVNPLVQIAVLKFLGGS
jgi:hypothetical protein